jgi:hypothetical protein
MNYKKEDFHFFKNNEDKGIRWDHVFSDLIDNKFDVTWHQNLPDNNPERIFSIIDPELKHGIIDDKTVTYKYNEDFFRSDSFKKDHKEKHILFSGCSETEGVGGNIEDAWSHMVYNKISKEEKVSGFFNLAKSGWGWSRIIINSLIYFDKYGYPDTYFILLPNHQRKFYYKETIENISPVREWTYFQTYPACYSQGNVRLKGSLPKEYLEDFTFFLIGWKTFLKVCKSNNVDVIFSTWDPLDSTNLKFGPFEEFFELEKNKLDKYFDKYYQTNQIKKDDIKKRDGHNGRISHTFWAEEFYEQYKKRGYDVK